MKGKKRRLEESQGGGKRRKLEKEKGRLDEEGKRLVKKEEKLEKRDEGHGGRQVPIRAPPSAVLSSSA